MEFPREALATIVAAHEYAPFFVALCGDYLHGWATPRSPFVLHGAHIIPLRDVLGLFPQIKTMHSSVDVANRRVVLQSHDLKLFLQLLVSKRGAVREELWSSLVVVDHPELATLRALGRGALSRHFVYAHHRALAAEHMERYRETRLRADLLLVVLALLGGTHLLRTGDLIAHLPTLAAAAELPLLNDVVVQHRHEQPFAPTLCGDVARMLPALDAALDTAYARSPLRERPTNQLDLHAFLLRMRGID
jgi:hypothetical protein